MAGRSDEQDAHARGVTGRRWTQTPPPLIAAAFPAALLLGAVAMQWILGLVPCEMCTWQREAHLAALAVACAAVAARSPRTGFALVVASASLVALSGLIGGYHAGVEYGWWEGHTACAAPPPNGLGDDDFLRDLVTRPIVRCDVPQWTMLGVSLAGWNMVASLAAATITVAAAIRGRRP